MTEPATGPSEAVQNMRKLKQLQDALNTLSTLTADVLIEDLEGGRYEFIKSMAIGQKTDDPGLVLRVRRTR